MGGLFGGGPSGPSAEEQKLAAKANWQSVQAERKDITGKYHGQLARLAAGGGKVDSQLGDIYKQQYSKEIKTLQGSQRYKDIGAYYNKQTGKSGGMASKGGQRAGLKGGGAARLGMEDWYTYQFGAKEEKAKLQPQVDIYQKEMDAAAEEQRKRNARGGIDFGSDGSSWGGGA